MALLPLQRREGGKEGGRGVEGWQESGKEREMEAETVYV